MITKVTQIFTFLMLVSVLLGCGGKENAPEPEPSKAELISPEQNSVCTTGVILSDTQSTVTFTWNPSADTDSYELHLKNLVTNTTTSQIVNTNQASMPILRNTPYSWYVVSKSNQAFGTAKSDTWKFYNSGLATITHSPFPADVVAPGYGQNLTSANKIKLSWLGSDVDGDIAGYDVYFGTTITPPLLQSNVIDMFLNDVTVAPGSTYYWKVVTNDVEGNSSSSFLFQFKVNQ